VANALPPWLHVGGVYGHGGAERIFRFRVLVSNPTNESWLFGESPPMGAGSPLLARSAA